MFRIEYVYIDFMVNIENVIEEVNGSFLEAIQYVIDLSDQGCSHFRIKKIA